MGIMQQKKKPKNWTSPLVSFGHIHWSLKEKKGPIDSKTEIKGKVEAIKSKWKRLNWYYTFIEHQFGICNLQNNPKGLFFV